MGKAKKRKSRDTDHEEATGDGDGKAAYQRPNCCDVLMLSLVCFFLIIVIAISIPLLLVATETADIEYISSKLKDPSKFQK